VRRVTEGLLEKLGYRVEAVGDGDAAVRAFEAAREARDPFDGVLLDLTVPGGAGAARTIERLRAIDPGVRALVTSGYADSPVLADPVGHGFRGAVAKPFTPETLARAMAQLEGGPVSTRF
jgi:CheY-like chemotaxis protein